MNDTTNFSRRNFLLGAAGGLVLGFVLPERTKLAAQAPPADLGRLPTANPWPTSALERMKVSPFSFQNPKSGRER